jgi:hypothetical protein
MSDHDLAKGSQVYLNVNCIEATFIREENIYGPNYHEVYKPLYVFEVRITAEEYENMINNTLKNKNIEEYKKTTQKK